jgi:hypothetical protein
MRRSLRSAIWGSWDASTIVMLCWSRSLAGRLRISAAFWESRFPVGSSAGSSPGVDQRAGDGRALLIVAGHPRGRRLLAVGQAYRCQPLSV